MSSASAGLCPSDPLTSGFVSRPHAQFYTPRAPS